MARRHRSKRAPTPPITAPIIMVLFPPDDEEATVAVEVEVAELAADVAASNCVEVVVAPWLFWPPGPPPFPACP